MKNLALLLIRIYQRYLSPLKGYRCAYGVLHQNGSCSQKVADIIEQHGVISSYPHIQTQFTMCSEAYEELKKKKYKVKERRKKDTDKCSPYDVCNPLECVPCGSIRISKPSNDCDLPCDDCSL